jgi:hypothetical protein
MGAIPSAATILSFPHMLHNKFIRTNSTKYVDLFREFSKRNASKNAGQRMNLELTSNLSVFLHMPLGSIPQRLMLL